MTMLRAGVCQVLIRVNAQRPFSGTGSATLLPQERHTARDCVP